MGWVQNVRARSQWHKPMRRAAVVAAPRALSAEELLRWAREWAPGTRITDDARLMLTKTIEVVGPLDVDEEMRKREKVPPGMVAVYLVDGGIDLHEDHSAD